MCKLHAWPTLNHSSTNTMQYMQYTVIFWYCPAFLKHLVCQHLLSRLVAHAQMTFLLWDSSNKNWIKTALSDTVVEWFGRL